MEKIKNPSKKLLKEFKTLSIVFIGIFILSSCVKSRVDPRLANSSHTVFVNVIPNGLSFNFYLDNLKTSNQAIAFSYSLPAIYISPGRRQIDLVLRNSTQSILTETVLVKAPNYYTVFATGKVTPEFVVLEDVQSNLISPPTGKAKVRLINLSSDAPNIDLAIAGGATLFTNLTYKANTPFINMDPGIYNLNFLETGTTTVKFTKKVLIDPGRLYNIFSLGAWDFQPGDAPLDMGLLDAVGQ
jgi:hypothetical protein